MLIVREVWGRPAMWAGLGLAWLLWLSFVQAFVVQWNAPRLAPAAALVRGLEIYGTAEAGPFLGWVYGPVFPAVFALVAWPSDQVVVLGAAWVLNVAVIAVPAWLLARAAGPPAAGRALVAGGLLALGTAVGRDALSFIHVDLLCAGLGGLACLALARGVGQAGSGWLAVAALASVLAVGTKQIAIGVMAGLMLWLWFGGHRPALLRYVGWLAVWGILGALVAGLGFGGERLIFNLWTVHRQNPLEPDFLISLAGRLGSLGWEAVPLLAGWWLTRIPPGSGLAPDAPARRMMQALAWVAWVHLPLGLMAAAKVAGGLNSIHTFHYLWFWLVMRLAQRWSMAGTPGRSRSAVLAAGLVLAWVQGWSGLWRAEPACWPQVQRLREEQAIADQHPGRVYFPWNPLVTILGENQVRPFDDALLCLDRCGLPASRAAVRAQIPRGAAVIYPDPVQSTFALTYLDGPAP